MFNKPSSLPKENVLDRKPRVPGSSSTSSGNNLYPNLENRNPPSSAHTPISGSEATPQLNPMSSDKSLAPASKEEEGGSRLIVGPDVKLKGAEILDCDTLVVEGRVEATMDSRVIRIAEGGAFSGKVSIDVAEIDGVFDGELTAREQLIIHATGRVRGKIRYGKLLIESGGQLSGEIESLNDSKEHELRRASAAAAEADRHKIQPLPQSAAG